MDDIARAVITAAEKILSEIELTGQKFLKKDAAAKSIKHGIKSLFLSPPLRSGLGNWIGAWKLDWGLEIGLLTQ